MRPDMLGILRVIAAVAIWLVLAATLSSCCCIPMSRDVVESPRVEVEVVDEDGEPVEGARVRMCRVRLGPPPSEVIDEWALETDERGRVTFEYRETEETVMPLMMHGVPQRTWEVCADHTDYAASQPSDGSRVLVERGSADETPHEAPLQTIALADPAADPTPCPCDVIAERTAQREKASRSAAQKRR